jgi:hypothetical protein
MAAVENHTGNLPKILGGSKFNEKGGSILLDNLHGFIFSIFELV